MFVREGFGFWDGLRFRDQGVGFRAWGLGFWVLGLRWFRLGRLRLGLWLVEGFVGSLSFLRPCFLAA